ncbi:MAG: hypothetical protein ACKVPY_06360 [Paracoccaceae bacterium]
MPHPADPPTPPAGRRRAFAPALALAFALLFAPAQFAPDPAMAQSTGPKSTQLETGAPDLPTGPLFTLSDPGTGGIVDHLASVTDTCGAIRHRRYRIDCLRVLYLRLADSIPATGDYAPVRQALLNAARKLDKIVEANLDPSLPTIRPRRIGVGQGHRIAPIRAVATDRLAAANAAAREVVRETGLLILRSGDRPPRRTQHYQQIATALDDNMILLRSG